MSNKKVGKRPSGSVGRLVDSLRRERDELSLQAKLGRMELRDEWQDVEAKWEAFESKIEEANDDAKQSLHELGQEISDIYKKLKKRLA